MEISGLPSADVPALDTARLATGWPLHGHEPWALWQPTRRSLRLAWLEDDVPAISLHPADATAGQAELTAGGAQTSVAARLAVRHESYQTITHSASTASQHPLVVRWEALTPTVFTRRGRQYPAPDLWCLFASLAAEWNQHANAAVQVDATHATKAASVIKVLSVKGRTADHNDGAGDTRTGFVGAVSILLDPATLGESGKNCVALLKSAEYLGIGEYRQAGMGATRIRMRRGYDDKHVDAARRPSRPAGPGRGHHRQNATNPPSGNDSAQGRSASRDSSTRTAKKVTDDAR